MWSLELTGEHRLSVSGNGVLRKMCGTKRDEVTGEWRSLHKGGALRSVGVFLSKCYRGDKILKNEMGGACVKCSR